jgi:ABC-type sulfate/molybdate transport systems ATPase subunit
VLTDVFDNSYNASQIVPDYSKLSSVFVTHSANTAFVTGEQILVSYFDASGNVKFTTGNYAFGINPDSPPVYEFYQDKAISVGDYKNAQIILRNDSIIVSLYNSYYCASYFDSRIFKGKKRGAMFW